MSDGRKEAAFGCILITVKTAGGYYWKLNFPWMTVGDTVYSKCINI